MIRIMPTMLFGEVAELMALLGIQDAPLATVRQTVGAFSWLALTFSMAHEM
jgi:hypothetical protein